jgi:hypothetical protein
MNDAANTASGVTLWLSVLGVVAIVAAVIAGVAVLVHFLLKLFRWLGKEIVAIVPEPYGRWFVGIVRFYYVAAMFCGLTAFGVSLAILGLPVPDTPGDPVLRNPLLRLTWLAVSAGIMIGGFRPAAVRGVDAGAAKAGRKEVMSCCFLSPGGWHQQILVGEQFAHVADRIHGVLFRRYRLEAMPQFAPRRRPAHPHRLVDIGARLRKLREPPRLRRVLDHNGRGNREIVHGADCIRHYRWLHRQATLTRQAANSATISALCIAGSQNRQKNRP